MPPRHSTSSFPWKTCQTNQYGRTMKGSKLECLPIHAGWRNNFVFVRVETDSGIICLGEAYSQYDRDRAIAAQVEELGRYVVGRDPFHIRHILQVAVDD